MITRSKIFEQIKAIDCGNTAFEKGKAQSALVVASAGSKELQTSDISTSNFVKIADLAEGDNWIDLATAKKYLKTNDSGAIAVLGDYPVDPNS